MTAKAYLSGGPVDEKLDFTALALAPGTLAVVSKLFKMVSRGYHSSFGTFVGRQVRIQRDSQIDTRVGDWKLEWMCGMLGRWKDAAEETEDLSTFETTSAFRGTSNLQLVPMLDG